MNKLNHAKADKLIEPKIKCTLIKEYKNELEKIRWNRIKKNQINLNKLYWIEWKGKIY